MKSAIANPKGNPVPVRFTETEETFLQAAGASTGLPTSELIRRAVRLMRRQQQMTSSYGFVVDLAN